MEIFENTAANNAGVAKRAIERLLKVITDGERAKAGIDRSNIAQLEEALDTLILLESGSVPLSAIAFKFLCI